MVCSDANADEQSNEGHARFGALGALLLELDPTTNQHLNAQPQSAADVVKIAQRATMEIRRLRNVNERLRRQMHQMLTEKNANETDVLSAENTATLVDSNSSHVEEASAHDPDRGVPAEPLLVRSTNTDPATASDEGHEPNSHQSSSSGDHSAAQ